MTKVEVFAPAKVNLTLHITGQRSDGYHLIDSLVAFADVGDRLVLSPDSTLSIAVKGTEAAGVPGDHSNLAYRAASLVADGRGAAIQLEKMLPAASGIGGGSADAAAAARGMLALRGHEPAEGLAEWLLSLGADIPMCLRCRPCRAQGIGAALSFPPLPELHAVLANPRVPVATSEVFGRLSTKNGSPMSARLPGFARAAEFVSWLGGQRNDLEAPAISAVPVIADVLAALGRLPGARLARMSGSGATCFAVFDDARAAEAAADRLRAEQALWWIASARLGDRQVDARPKVT